MSPLRWGRFPICRHGPAAHQLNMKTMWDRRCRLSIRTKGGKVLLGLDLRSLRLGPAPTFFKGVKCPHAGKKSDENGIRVEAALEIVDGTGVGEAARVFDRGPIRKNKCGCLASEPRGRAERVMVTESFGPVPCRFGQKGTGTRRWKQRWKRQQSPAVFWRESTFTRRCWR